jgi:hypothetical protein
MTAIKPLALAMAVASLVGCAEKPPKPMEPVDYHKKTSVHAVEEGRYQTTSSSSRDVAGASINQAAYVHVLHTEPPNGGKTPKVISNTVAPDEVPANQVATVPAHGEPPADAETKAKKTAPVASVEEDAIRRAWRRFCNAGGGMTDEDWQIVANKPIPDDFKAKCLPPK